MSRGGSSRKGSGRALILAFACASCAPAPAPKAKASSDRPERLPVTEIERAAPSRPKLIVQITIDQLRADQLVRFTSRFGNGGFRRFLENGTYYGSAHYQHGPTETAVGHATLFTGALPQVHGIVGNEWYDPGTKRRRFSVEDAAHRWLDHHTPIDGGTSPRAMRVPTIGDEMVLASDGRALVYAVSIKDRAAILPAGFQGKAFWYDDKSGDFVTSDYYFGTTPEFLRAFNATRPSDRYRTLAWDLLRAREEYERSEFDDRAFEKSYKTLGRTFPHRLDGGPPEALYAMLKRTPFADELALDLTKALLEQTALGADSVTDLLAISFSATDYISHVFGPESLEAEDNLLRVDATLSRLFELLLSRMREAELLVVLSSDHGGCDSPESLKALGMDAEHHDPGALLTRLNDGLEKRFGQGARFAIDFSNPTVWLDEAAIAARSLSVEVVERALAERVLAERGFAYAVTKTDLAGGTVPRGPIHDLIANAFDRERTGNVYLVPKRGWLLATDWKSLTSMHGTPWDFDRHVPIAFYGAGVRARHVLRPVDPRDIAPTLAALQSIEAPRGASGTVLREVLER